MFPNLNLFGTGRQALCCTLLFALPLFAFCIPRYSCDSFTATHSPDNKIDTLSLGAWIGLRAAVRHKLDSLIGEFEKKEQEMFPAPGDSSYIGRTPMDSDHAVELYELERRILLLKAAIDNIDRLEKSTQVYAISYVESGKYGGTLYNLTHHNIIFFIQENNVSSFIHETTHGGQFEKGGIVYRRISRHVTNSLLKINKDSLAGGFGDDFGDEIEAYRAQFAFDPSSVSGLDTAVKVNSLDAIDASWVVHLKWDNQHPYEVGGSADLALIPVTVQSDLKSLKEAYPWYPWKKIEDQWQGPHPLKSKKCWYKTSKR